MPASTTFTLDEPDKKGAFVTAAALASFPVASGIVTAIWKILGLTTWPFLVGQGGIALAALLVGATLWR